LLIFVAFSLVSTAVDAHRFVITLVFVDFITNRQWVCNFLEGD